MPSTPITDLAQFQRAVDRLLARIPSPYNQTTVKRYIRDRRVQQMKLGTILSDLNALVSFSIHVDLKNLQNEVTREDVLDYIEQAQRVRIWRNLDRDGKETVTEKVVPLKPSTLAHRKIVIRAFFKWLRGTDHYPPEVANLGGRPRDQGTTVADRLIGADDLKRLIAAQRDSRCRAIAAFLYETGLRAQEFCSLNVGSVRFEGNRAYIRLPRDAPGLKTGAREVFIFDSLPYLQQWLLDHPWPHDPEAPLFVSMSRRKPNARFTNGALYSFCIRAGRSAGLPMETNPHLFRHSAATERARLGWPEAFLRQYFGWTKDSDMPSRYVHLAARDCERLELARRGLLTDSDKPQPALMAILCRACNAPNTPTAAFCCKCNLPVSPAAAAEAKRLNLESMKEEMAKLVMETIKGLQSSRGAPVDLGNVPPIQASTAG